MKFFTFYILFDATKVVDAITIDAKNKAIAGGIFPKHSMSLEGFTENGIKKIN